MPWMLFFYIMIWGYVNFWFGDYCSKEGLTINHDKSKMNFFTKKSLTHLIGLANEWEEIVTNN